MRRNIKVLVGVVAVVGGLVVAQAFILPQLIECHSTRLAEAESPDGHWIARLSSEQCEERGRIGVYVWLYDSDETTGIELLRAPPNSTNIHLHWAHERELRISFPETLPASEGAPEIDGVKVTLERVSDREMSVGDS